MIPKIFRRSLSVLTQPEVTLRFDGDGFANLILNRPEVHNAFNNKIVEQLSQCVLEVSQRMPRALFVSSIGKSFSAGGDLNYMKEMADASKERNINDAVALSQFLCDLSNVPVPTVALVQGPAFGGGVGLISVCDIAIGVKSAIFALSEVKLGLIPATISPYVIQRIGSAQSRRYFLTGEKFDAATAFKIGLLHEVVDSNEDLLIWRDRFKKEFKMNSPSGMSASKQLIRAVEGQTIDKNLILDTANRLAEQRSSIEGKEGIKAFLEKRPASYSQK